MRLEISTHKTILLQILKDILLGHDNLTVLLSDVILVETAESTNHFLYSPVIFAF